MHVDLDDRLLARTLALARKGQGQVPPNPMVGAVVAGDHRIISEGHHERYGGPHAEAIALAHAGDQARGAVLYCSLEPCSFDAPGKHQPPCVAAIIGAGIRRVVVGQLDPNPLVRGSGVAALRSAGITVDVADDEACWELNDGFNTAMALGRPFVHIKSAISLDGRIAAAGGKSRWITDEAARRDAHALRATVDAVVVGIGTVLADDPLLTVRIDGRDVRQPRAVVFDSTLRIPLSSHLVRERPQMLIVLAARRDQDPSWNSRCRTLRDAGVTVLEVPHARPEERPEPAAALQALYRAGLRSLLVEGGAALITSFVRSALYDRLTLYRSPMLLGDGVAFLGDLGIRDPAHGVRFEAVRYRTIGEQDVVEARRAGWLAEMRAAVAGEELRVHGTR